MVIDTYKLGLYAIYSLFPNAFVSIESIIQQWAPWLICPSQVVCTWLFTPTTTCVEWFLHFRMQNRSPPTTWKARTPAYAASISCWSLKTLAPILTLFFNGSATNRSTAQLEWDHLDVEPTSMKKWRISRLLLRKSECLKVGYTLSSTTWTRHIDDAFYKVRIITHLGFIIYFTYCIA